MIRRPTMRRALVAALASVSLLIPAQAAVAEETNEVPRHVCDFDWREGTWHIKQLIKCAARKWDSPGAPMKAIEVARCESHLNPEAYSSGNAGLFQHAVRYWPDRADRFGQPDRSAFNGRANIIVSIRMARSMGSWSAWAGCA
ncbi:MAG TPA: hypothetical protein VFK59_07900 [Actinomycetota bacterium]|nr:hypothetical protein [Actinomycetota bacterium]